MAKPRIIVGSQIPCYLCEQKKSERAW